MRERRPPRSDRCLVPKLRRPAAVRLIVAVLTDDAVDSERAAAVLVLTAVRLAHDAEKLDVAADQRRVAATLQSAGAMMSAAVERGDPRKRSSPRPSVPMPTFRRSRRTVVAAYAFDGPAARAPKRGADFRSRWRSWQRRIDI